MDVGILLFGMLLGLTVGAGAVWLWQQAAAKSLREQAQTQSLRAESAERSLATAQAENQQLREERARLVALQESLEGQNAGLSTEVLQLREAHQQAGMQLTRLQEELKHVQAGESQRKEELDRLREETRVQFEKLSAELLQKNSQEFLKNSGERVQEVLKPFRDHIESFRKDVGEHFEKTLKDTSSLKTELDRLNQTSLTLNSQAQHLTQALKGDKKAQGNWGEMLLENLLQSMGLPLGPAGYEKQVYQNPENARQYIDFVLHLPGGREVVLDSKVPLSAWERHVSAEDEAAREAARLELVGNLKNHILDMGNRNYAGIRPNAAKFTVLFIPIEGAFNLALSSAKPVDLLALAHEKHVVLASPSQLSAMVHLVNQMWQHDRIARNARAIAELGGAMYDKLVTAMESFHKLGKSIDQARGHYDSTLKNMTEGRGNLLKKAEDMKKLGAKTTKSLPEDLLEGTDDLEEVEARALPDALPES